MSSQQTKIAIVGYGSEGQANYRYFKQHGEITIVDENQISSQTPSGVSTLIGDKAFSQLDDFDLVLRSPGVAPAKIKTNGKIWSASNEFFTKCPAPIIGVTGTKGKGTTSSLIAAILRAAGKTVHLVGNIGQPALDTLADIDSNDIVVYELSSFQLWDLESSPHVAVVLMIEADHLDIHRGMSDYVAAKSHITAYQTAADIVVYNQNNQYCLDIANISAAETKLAYPQDISLFTEDLQLPGRHNIENASAAILAARSVLDISDDAIGQGLASFKGLDHRLKYVDTVNDVDYYDDSIATTPGSALAAINSFANKPKVIILGGHDKGADYQPVIDLAKHTDTALVTAGSNGQKIAELAEAAGVKYVHQTGDMAAVVGAAAELSQPGSVVLLSPAAASFDQYKSYQDRGDQFIAAVQNLKSGR